ncbi:PAS domain S-box protein [Thalassoglobus sp.]|uniref:PAS domain S-box protein n=1 Tax=Thalassoglobus sp. TaxID=2795869 RepID=UPI003AA90ED7
MAENWQSLFFEQVQDAYIVIDVNSVVLSWSAQAEKLFGWSADEAVGTTLASLIIRDEDLDAHLSGLKTYQSTGDGPLINNTTKHIARTKSGSTVPVELYVVPIKSGENFQFVGCVREAEEIDRQSIFRPALESFPGEENSIQIALQNALQEICTTLGWEVGHGLIVDELEKSLVSTEIWQFATQEVASQAADLKNATHFLLGEDLPGRAWESHEEVWLTSTNSPRVRDNASLSEFFNSGVAVPILTDGSVSAVLEFFDSGDRAQSPEVVDLIKQSASKLSYELERHRWHREMSFLAEIVESTTDAVIGKDRAGKIVLWNHGAELTYGYSEAEALGKSISIILPDGVNEEEQEIRDIVATQKRLSSFETVRRNKAGELLDISLTITPIRDRENRWIGSATIERDITAFTESIYELHDREEKLRLIMEASGEAIYGIDLEGKCTFANRACMQILGYESMDQVHGQDMHLLTHHSFADGSEYPRHQCKILQTFRLGKSIHIQDEVFWKKDNTSFPAEYWSSPIRRGDEIVGAVIVFEDATQKQADDRTRAELAAIVESSRDAIVGKSLDGIIKTWNRSAEELYGYSAEEAIGQAYSSLVCQGDDSESTIQEIHNDDSGIPIEAVRRRKDGTLIDVGVTESAIHIAQGKIIGTASIERDITVRKQREAELESARKTAEVANQTKTEFLANISHELRTPMNGVLGMLQVALEEQLPAALRDYLATAHDSAETLLLLLDELLDFSRLETGQFEIISETFDIHSEIDLALKALALRAHEKGLELIVDIDPNVPVWVEGDAGRLRQIITNLVGNSIKFTDVGDIVLKVSNESRTEEFIRLKFIVKDTGIGISDENLETIFSPFTQVDSSMTRSRSGSGLGLAICDELIEKMGGTISVTSEVGVGTTFEVNLLFRFANKPEHHPDLRQLAGEQALIVDDNDANREILSKLLDNFSMRVNSAENAGEAINLLRKSSDSESMFGIAIIDSLMPETDGMSLVQELRNQGNNMPIILMVSPGERLAVEQNAQKLGISTFLEKPVSRSDVFDAVMTALRGPQLTRESFEELTPVTHRALSVLVAEDTPANQKVVRAILERRGHQVTIAHNGKEALTKLNNDQSFDIILMDVQMPVMDGLQATRAIRDQKEFHDIPIIAMTAHARREDRRRCLQAGMSGYISKPLDVNKLIRLIEKFSKSKKSSPAQVESKSPVREKVQPTMIVNLDAALKRLGDDEELLDCMKTAFLEDSPQLLEEIKTAHENSSFPELHRAAHSLKGLASNFDAFKLVASAAEIENAAKVSQPVEPTLIAQVERDLDDVRKAVQ